MLLKKLSLPVSQADFNLSQEIMTFLEEYHPRIIKTSTNINNISILDTSVLEPSEEDIAMMRSTDPQRSFLLSPLPIIFALLLFPIIIPTIILFIELNNKGEKRFDVSARKRKKRSVNNLKKSSNNKKNCFECNRNSLRSEDKHSWKPSTKISMIHSVDTMKISLTSLDKIS